MANDGARESDRVRDLGEFGLIDRIRTVVGGSSAVLGIGDDAAVLDLGGPDLLLATVDMQVQDVHFVLEEQSGMEVGRRVIAVNVSDIAAMGGSPTFALTSLALPPDTSTSWVDDLYAGMRDECRQWGAEIVGGNFTRTEGPVCIDVTMLGSCPRDQVVPRRGAVLGDLLAVTGSLGNRAALRYARSYPVSTEGLALPEWVEHAMRVHPKVREARTLAANHLVHAMIDLSDGLAGDVAHLCRESNVGAMIDWEQLPIESPVRAIAPAVQQAPEVLALYGGEDYELLVALDAKSLQRASQIAPDLALHVVGRIVPAFEGITVITGTWRRPLRVGDAWRHF